ncbi:HNH endonuclease [bacterium]|nr:HNH endonuclease [bacterium]
MCTHNHHVWKHDVKERQGFICPICGKKCNETDMNIHHKVPKSCGGETTRDNVVAWCIECHTKYHRRYKTAVSDDEGHPLYSV